MCTDDGGVGDYYCIYIIVLSSCYLKYRNNCHCSTAEVVTAYELCGASNNNNDIYIYYTMYVARVLGHGQTHCN